MKKIIADDSYTYSDCVTPSSLMAHYIKDMMRKGDKYGRPIINPEKGHVPPPGTQVYDPMKAITNYKSHMTKPHSEFPLFRAASLNEAFEYVRNEGHPPIQVRAADMPTGVQWNNYPDCLYRCHAKYCALEGMSRSSDVALEILYFMFYGHFQWATTTSKKVAVTRTKPFIFYMHKKMVGGRSRFAAKVPHHFAKFISLFEKNKDAWTEYLMDKGEGNPPVEYLVAFEEGLRNYADCVHSLGTRPLRSKKAWKNVAKWRKREAYIALARYLLRADSGYKQWDCFRFADFTMRVTMGLTFENRHYRLSDGEDDKNFGKGNMNFDWKKHSYVPTKRVKSEPGEYKAKNVVDTSATDETPMIYDVELGKLVPLE